MESGIHRPTHPVLQQVQQTYSLVKHHFTAQVQLIQMVTKSNIDSTGMLVELMNTVDGRPSVFLDKQRVPLIHGMLRVPTW